MFLVTLIAASILPSEDASIACEIASVIFCSLNFCWLWSLLKIILSFIVIFLLKYSYVVCKNTFSHNFIKIELLKHSKKREIDD